MDVSPPSTSDDITAESCTSGAGASFVSITEFCFITFLIALSSSDGRRITTDKVNWNSSSSETTTK